MLSKIHILVFLLLGCTTARIKNGNTAESLPGEKLNIGAAANGENKIAFITFGVTLTDSIKDLYDFKVLKMSFAAGQLKKDPMNNFPLEPNFLYCEILDETNSKTDFIRVENPLLKIYEYNEKPESPLNKKAFTSRQGEFVLRFQIDKKAKYLNIYKASSIHKTLKKIYHATI